MPKRMKVREVIKLLEADGWFLARTRGSHRQFNHPTKPGTVTVSGKLGVSSIRGSCVVFFDRRDWRYRCDDI